MQQLISISVLFLTLSKKKKKKKKKHPFMTDKFTELDTPIIIKPNKNDPIAANYIYFNFFHKSVDFETSLGAIMGIQV